MPNPLVNLVRIGALKNRELPNVLYVPRKFPDLENGAIHKATITFRFWDNLDGSELTISKLEIPTIRENPLLWAIKLGPKIDAPSMRLRTPIRFAELSSGSEYQAEITFHLMDDIDGSVLLIRTIEPIAQVIPEMDLIPQGTKKEPGHRHITASPS